MSARLSPYGLLISLALLVAAASTVPAHAQQSSPPACDELEGFQLLDFWVGEWRVVDPEGNFQGNNRIEKILSGCAIMEHWEGAGGSAGKSLFYYDHLSRVWKQVWVTGNATRVGGLKEKRLIERLPDGALRFQGVITLPDGRTFLDRTTLTPLPDGRVEQILEVSRDGGTEWSRTFTGIYEPAGSP